MNLPDKQQHMLTVRERFAGGEEGEEAGKQQIYQT
jgi:hypothetical protein